MGRIDEYRRGYEAGVAARESAAEAFKEALFAPLGAFESSDYKQGYQDGVHGREFNPPSPDDDD